MMTNFAGITDEKVAYGAALDERTTVNDAVQRYPETLPVFRAFGIDTCCGGPLPLSEAATRHGYDVSDVMDALRAALRTSACNGELETE